jgi:hypothetical protein
MNNNSFKKVFNNMDNYQKTQENKIIDIPHIIKELNCYTFAFCDLTKKKYNYYENSDKIILPHSMVNILNQSKYTHFRLTKKYNEQYQEVYVGIGDFCAPEKTCYVPQWIFDCLNLKDGDNILIESVLLPNTKKIKALISKDIKNYKPVLEYILRNHTALFIGKIINVRVFEKIYNIKIIELNPDHATSIISCDPEIEVEFV